MSIVLCDVCESTIDTDDDVDAFQVYCGLEGAWICEKCREEQNDLQEEARNA